jgi:hypothetical protein
VRKGQSLPEEPVSPLCLTTLVHPGARKGRSANSMCTEFCELRSEGSKKFAEQVGRCAVQGTCLNRPGSTLRLVTQEARDGVPTMEDA